MIYKIVTLFIWQSHVCEIVVHSLAYKYIEMRDVKVCRQKMTNDIILVCATYQINDLRHFKFNTMRVLTKVEIYLTMRDN